MIDESQYTGPIHEESGKNVKAYGKDPTHSRFPHAEQRMRSPSDGTRRKQCILVGNAVPPLLAAKIAEKIKIQIGAAIEDLESPPEDMSVQGRDLLTGKPKQVIVSYREIAKALDKSIQRIEDAVMETLSQTPPELAADIYNTGIYLAGGGSMLRGLDKRISQKTDLPVYIAEDPLRAVVRGTGMALKDIPRFRSILIK
jgi:actin-like ATPase involved in cell morphogenesis